MRRLASAVALLLLSEGCSSSGKNPGAPTDAGAALDAAPPALVTDGGGSVELFQTSRAGDKCADKGALAVYSGPRSGRTKIAVSATQRQTVLGFGGAITDSVASVLNALPAAARSAAIDAYFSSTGSGYTFTRTHIASCDFSPASYQYSTTPDPALPDFSVAHDEAELIPLLKDAVTSSAGALKVLASPWSAPAWMKSPAQLYVPPTAANGYSGTDPVLQSQFYDAYALYLVKYIQAYKADGVDVWGITPQNEPLGNGGNWETMAWTPDAMNTFLKTNLATRLSTAGLDVKILAYDHNKGPVDADFVQWATTFYRDPQTSPVLYGSATHWYGSTVNVYEDSLDAVHALDPSKVILATEGTLDGLTDLAGQPASSTYQYSWLNDDFYWTKDEYDWGFWYATGSDKALHPAYEPVYRYARDIIVGLNHWYAGWIDWNIALDKDGGPNHAKNWCGAGMMVDTVAQTVYYSPIFYVLRQFSRYIRPGAVVLASSVTLAPGVSLNGADGKSTDGLLSVSAQNTDGSLVTVVFNETGTAIDYDVTARGLAVQGSAPAQSLQTLVWTPGR